MNWKLVECEIALIVSLTVIECVNMGQNSPKDITCLTVFFCIMIVLLPLIGVLQQWHLSCFQNRQKEKEYQAKQETDEKMKTWLLAREAIIKDKEKEELTNKVNGLQQKCDSLIENQENELKKFYLSILSIIGTKDDLKSIEENFKKMMRVGMGYDVHQLVEGRDLILGGVNIPYEKGLLGHSDADVLLHAITDAILGAAALGDIGKHFPDTDPAYHNADSMKLLAEVVRLIEEKGYEIGNVDATVIAQRPKLLNYIPTMKENISKTLKVDPDQVNVKATTEEHLGFTGEGLGISAQAVCLLNETK